MIPMPARVLTLIALAASMLAGLPTTALPVLPGDTPSPRILYVDGDFPLKMDVPDALSALGYEISAVTELQARPDADVILWVSCIMAPMSAAEEARVMEHVRAGGTAFLQGEWGDYFVEQDAQLGRIVNALVRHDPLLPVSVGQQGSVPAPYRLTAPGSLALGLTDFSLTFPGVAVGCLSGHERRNALLLGRDGSTVAAAWSGADLTSGKGRLLLVMDASWAKQAGAKTWLAAFAGYLAGDLAD